MNRLMNTAIAATLMNAAFLLASPAFAAPKTDAAPTTASDTQTDVIGSKEAPSVFNIVPWKDRAGSMKKREVSTSILRTTLQPLDGDVLRREIRLQQSLSNE